MRESIRYQQIIKYKIFFLKLQQIMENNFKDGIEKI